MKRYKDYNSFVKKKYGAKIIKIPVDAGFSCPNRDGKKGRGGCVFCNNETFSPSYCRSYSDSFTKGSPSHIKKQLDEGLSFFSHRHKNISSSLVLAYFQAFSNTYASLDVLKMRYEAALSHPYIDGIIIGTRPDCIDEACAQYIAHCMKKTSFLAVEIGIESTSDKTLKRINRAHDFEAVKKACDILSFYNIPIGAHLILGLPGETKRDMISHAQKVSRLPIQYLKLHQLQIVKGSTLENNYEKGKTIKLFSSSEYVSLVISFLEHLSPHIVIERFLSQTPPSSLLAPKWGLRNYEFQQLLEKKLEENNTFQGKLFT